MRRVLLILITLTGSGCCCLGLAKILGPSDFLIELKSVAIRDSPYQSPCYKSGVPYIAVEFTSSTDLSELLESRMIQVRCTESRSFRYDWPFFGDVLHNGIVLELGQKMRLTGNVFVYETVTRAGDLEAYLDAHKESRSSISYFLLGVAKAPVYFPRSNSFTLKYDEIEMLFKEYRSSHH